MEIISVNIVQMEFIVQLGTVETVAWLDTLGIVITLTRGVDWADVEINTNILEIATQHGYFIKWPCDISDAVPHCNRCLFKKGEVSGTHFIVGVGILTFGGTGGSGRVKLTNHRQKEIWLHCVHFVLWCNKLHHNVSLHLRHTNYVTVYELTCFRVACIHAFSVMCL